MGIVKVIGLVALLGVAACYGPSLSEGAPCDPALDSCPTGQTCTATGGGYYCTNMGVAPGDATDGEGPDGDAPDANPGDRDGDGVANAVDNCPDDANADQANEDGDALGDACDPCPPFATNDDTDGDGVGDLCDPNPSTGGDHIALFQGFKSGIPAGWSNAAWTAAGDDAVLVSASNQIDFLGATVTPAAHGMAMMAFKVDEVFGMPTGLGITNPSASDASSGLACEITVGGAGIHQAGIADVGTGTPVQVSALPWAADDEMIVTFHRTDDNYACNAENLSNPGTVDKTTMITLSPTSPVIAIRSRSTSTHVHWLMYVTSP